MNMRYRDAHIEDLPAIVAIYNSTIEGRMVTADTEPVLVSDKEAWFWQHNTSHRPLWVVEDDTRNMIGWISFQDFYGRPAYQGTAEISIYMAEAFRGQGLGRFLLQYSIDQCTSLGIHTLLGFIFAHNEPSLKLFMNLGFEEWANLLDIAVLDGQSRSLKILGKKIS
ncbi:MAG TPA: N-acetyltransferase family protein [Ferruginibacter sp.]|nr:N-acetyltransferase family protein [Ferruginibacter sp.]